MGVYIYSGEQIERLLARSKRVRVRFTLVAGALMAAILTIPASKLAPYPRLRQSVHPLVIALIVALVDLLKPWKRSPAKLENRLRNMMIEISSAGVRLNSSFGNREFQRMEILRGEEPPWGGGLYLRTSNRYRWMVLPKTIDHYDLLKAELLSLGIGLERTGFPPNWEEFIFVLLFIGTIICSAVAHDVRVLTANLGISIFLALIGWLIVGANHDMETGLGWKVKFGLALPLAFSLLGLWMAVWR